jgi:hypothetical protein
MPVVDAEWTQFEGELLQRESSRSSGEGLAACFVGNGRIAGFKGS